MNNISYQFYHDIENGVCVAFEDTYFVKSNLEDPGKVGENYTYFNIGFAYCSSLDNYSRKVGREVSSKRISTVKFNLYSCIWEGEKTYWIFRNNRTFLTFTTRSDSQKVYFIRYEKRYE